MALQFSPYMAISGSAALALIILAAYLWPRRTRVGSILYFEVMLLGLIIWVVGNIAEIAFIDPKVKFVATIVVYLGVVIAVPGWFTFTAAYTGREGWLTGRTIALLTIHPVLVMIATTTNRWHQLFWPVRELTSFDNLVVVISTTGTLFWVHAAYAYSMILAGVVLLLINFFRSPRLYRGQQLLLIIAAFAPWVANALFIFNISPLPPYIDITPLAFTITALAIGYSVLRFSLLDIVPVARGTVVDGIADAVLVIDNQFRVVDINPAGRRLIGRGDGRIIGQSIREILSGRDDLVAQFADVEAAKTEVKFSLDGEEHEYALTISPLKNQRGDLMGRVILLHEITELKRITRELAQARSEAEEANRLKSQFLATMSHELRTPLNAISGFTELMLEGMAGELSPLQRNNLSRVLTNATDLRKLIDDLLDLSRIEAGHVDLVMSPVNLQNWLDELARQTQSLAIQKGLSYETRLDASLPTQIKGDAARLKQVVLNLVSNAIKFTDKGLVQVEILRDEATSWQIRVSDSGIGIPPHAQSSIFETFRQVDGSPARKHGGSGLGLSITRSLVLAMGGTIHVKSNVNEGSIFTVTLPLIPVEAMERGK